MTYLEFQNTEAINAFLTKMRSVGMQNYFVVAEIGAAGNFIEQVRPVLVIYSFFKRFGESESFVSSCVGIPTGRHGTETTAKLLCADQGTYRRIV